jgi:hypothetical protein
MIAPICQRHNTQTVIANNTCASRKQWEACEEC